MGAVKPMKSLLVVAAVSLACAGCGNDESTAGIVYPDLECDGARNGAFEPDLDPEVPGAPTIDRAIDPVLDGFSHQFDGEVVVLRPDKKAMRVNGRIVFAVVAREAPAGGYWADHVEYCQPFMIESSAGEAPATAPSVAETMVSCEPVPRFRLGNIEYENRRFDELVAAADLGSLVGEIEVYPAGLGRCEPVTLKNGEGSWPVGTSIYEIVGVDPAESLTATLGNNVYLVFHGHPVTET
jgi:hypothetical protein